MLGAGLGLEYIDMLRFWSLFVFRHSPVFSILFTFSGPAEWFLQAFLFLFFSPHISTNLYLSFRHFLLPFSFATFSKQDDVHDELTSAEEVISSGKMSKDDWDECQRLVQALFRFGQEVGFSRLFYCFNFICWFEQDRLTATLRQRHFYTIDTPFTYHLQIVYKLYTVFRDREICRWRFQYPHTLCCGLSYNWNQLFCSSLEKFLSWTYFILSIQGVDLLGWFGDVYFCFHKKKAGVPSSLFRFLVCKIAVNTWNKSNYCVRLAPHPFSRLVTSDILLFFGKTRFSNYLYWITCIEWFLYRRTWGF